MLLLIVLIVFPFACLFVLHVLANISGWDRLSETFPQSTDVPIREFWFQSVKCGMVYYKHCCVIGIGHEELFIRIMKPFVFAHQPIAIPYASLTAVVTKGFFVKTAVMRISGTERSVEIAERMVDQVLRLTGVDLRNN